MLTIKQPVQYGYKSVHDLPTPPSTSRPSPPLVYQETAPKAPPSNPRSSSPLSGQQPMSAPHRGLPPPAALTLAQPPPPPSVAPQMGQAPPPSHPPHAQTHLQAHHGIQTHQPSHTLGQLPAPPQWQQGLDDSMRAWLLAKAEEEKRRQEEEKTRQETLRLEQRRMEHEILRTSLQGGIPPPMVPVVFAGMGGHTLPQAALDWAHQFMFSQQHQHPQPQAHQPQLLPAAGPISPEHRRDSQSQQYGAYPSTGTVPSTPGSAQGGPQGGFIAQPPSSPARPRGISLPGTRPHLAGGSGLPTLNTNVPQGAAGPGGSAQPAHPGVASAQAQSQTQTEQAQASPSIYFHHWHPPASHTSGGSSSNQPATPSGSSKTRARS